MTGIKPEAGLVIRHMYLWRNEAQQGKEEGRKARPCLVVYSKQNEFGNTEVYIAPITHSPPKSPQHAIEIPLEIKNRLKLDYERSWIITSEINRFTWVGPDVRKTPSGDFAYGYLSPGLTRKAMLQVQENACNRELDVVGRDDNELKQRLEKMSRDVKARTRKPKDRDR